MELIVLEMEGAINRGEADCIRRAWEVEQSGRMRRCGMNNHLTGSGALDRDEGHAADLCNQSWSGMVASCVSSNDRTALNGREQQVLYCIKLWIQMSDGVPL